MEAGVPPGSSFTYAALGASDVVGVGSSQPCAAPFQDCNGNSYVYVAARQLRTQGYTVTVSPLGISGAVIGKILDEELPLVPREAKLVTIFTGGNDARGIAGAVSNGLGGSDGVHFIFLSGAAEFLQPDDPVLRQIEGAPAAPPQPAPRLATR
jgi:lysophospholipase L1-like esterase